MADSTGAIRVKLDMRKSDPDKFELIWMVVDPSEISTVKQLVKLLKHRFLLVGKHKLYLEGAWLPPIESIRVLRDNDTVSVISEDTCSSKKFNSVPNATVQNGGLKRHLEEPDLQPPKKKKKKPPYQFLSAEELPTELAVVEDQAAATSITVEPTRQPPTPTELPLQTRDLQTTQDGSCCSDQNGSNCSVAAVVRGRPESRLQDGLDTTAALMPDMSLFTTPAGPKKKRPRKRKKKAKVMVTAEPAVNINPAVFVPLRVSVEPKGKHQRFDHESHWDEMEADDAGQRKADDGGLKEADDRVQKEADNGGQGEADDEGQNDADGYKAFLPDDCSTPVLQEMLLDKSKQTPLSVEKCQKSCELQSPGPIMAGRGAGDFRAVPPPHGTAPRTLPEQVTPRSAATAETVTRVEPQTAVKSYTDFPKLKTPPRVGDVIAFK
ncbi:unnamed protein product, partial [Ixodes hexagonus]